MHLVYYVALHNPGSQCTRFEKCGSSWLDVTISTAVIKYYVRGSSWSKEHSLLSEIDKCDALDLCYDRTWRGCAGETGHFCWGRSWFLTALGMHIWMPLNWGLTRIWGLESGGSFLHEGVGPGAPDCPVVPRAKRFSISLTCAQIGGSGWCRLVTSFNPHSTLILR